MHIKKVTHNETYSLKVALSETNYSKVKNVATCNCILWGNMAVDSKGAVDRERGARFYTLIVKRGLKQVNVATHLEISKTTVSRWCKGHPISPKYLDALCNFLQTTPSEIYDKRTPHIALERQWLDLYRALTKENFNLMMELGLKLARSQ